MKMYDLTVNSHGYAVPMRDGFFKHAGDISISDYCDDDYIIVGNYRIYKGDLKLQHTRQAIEKYLKMNGLKYKMINAWEKLRNTEDIPIEM